MQPPSPHALFGVSDILCVIFALFIKHFDPHVDIINPRKSLGLVNKDWNRLLQTPELVSERLLSPGLNLLKLRDYTVFIEEEEQQFEELKLALDYSNITANDLGALIARCEYLPAFGLFSEPLAAQSEDLTINIDAVAKNLIYFTRLRHVVDGTNDLLTRFTESYRPKSPRFLSWKYFKSRNDPIDLSDTTKLFDALLEFLRDEDNVADKRLSHVMLTKLCLIQDAMGEFYESLFHNIVHEVVRVLYSEGDSKGLSELLHTLDHVKLRNGMPLGAYSIYVPLILAVISECETFIRFVENSEYAFDQVIERLSEHFKETGEGYDQLEIIQLLLRRIQNDPALTLDMICHNSDIAIISRFENVLIRYGFRGRVLKRNLASAIESAPTEKQQEILCFVLYSLDDMFG